MLPSMGKLLERVVHDQIYNYHNSNNLSTPEQAGFRPGHSTNTCSLSLLDHVYLAMDKKHITGAVFLDLKKGF